jgi:hypothetical protein
MAGDHRRVVGYFGIEHPQGRHTAAVVDAQQPAIKALKVENQLHWRSKSSFGQIRFSVEDLTSPQVGGVLLISEFRKTKHFRC